MLNCLDCWCGLKKNKILLQKHKPYHFKYHYFHGYRHTDNFQQINSDINCDRKDKNQVIVMTAGGLVRVFLSCPVCAWWE